MKLLLLEDNPDDAELILWKLKKAGITFRSERVFTRNDFAEAIRSFQPDLIISDYRLPSFNGIEALKDLKHINPSIPFLLVSGAIGEEVAVEAMRAGASSYVLKDNMIRLPQEVERAIREAREHQKLRKFEEKQQVSYRIAQAATQKALDLKSLSKAIHEEIATVMTGNLHIAVYDKKKNYITFPYHSDTEGRHRQYRSRTFSNGLTEYVITSGKPLFINSTEELEVFVAEKKLGIFFTKYPKSLLAIPLRHDGQIIGVLAVQSYEKDKAYGEDDLELLEFVSGLIGTVIQKQEAQDEIKRNEEKYRKLYHSTPVMMHSIDREGKLVSVSAYWLDKMGYTEEEVLGRKSTEFLTPASRKRAEDEVIPQFFKTGETRNQAYQMVTKGGEVMDVLISATSERDAQGKVLRSLAVITDVTAEKQAERELERNRQRYKELVEYAPDIIVVYNSHTGVFADFSDKAMHFFGYAREALLRMSLIDVSPEYQPNGRLSAEEEAEIRQQILTGERTSFEWTVINDEGREIPCEVRVALMPSDEQTLIRCSISDRTEINEARKEVRQSLLELTWIDRVNQASFEHASLEEIGKLMLKAIRALTPSYGTRFYLYREDQDSLELIHEMLDDNVVSRIQSKVSVKQQDTVPVLRQSHYFRKVLDDRELFITNDQETIREIFAEHSGNNRAFKTLIPWVKRMFRTKGYAIIPLVSKDKVLGLCTVAFTEPISTATTKPIERFTKGIMAAMSRVIAESDLVKQREFTEHILNNLPADLVVFDAGQKYVFINPKAIKNEEIRQWMIGKDDFDYCRYKRINEDRALERRQHFQEALESRQVVQWTESIQQIGGETRHFLRFLYPIFDKEEFKYMIGYGVEITDLVKTQQALAVENRNTKQFQSMLLSSQLNPHFIFNALSSIQYYVLDNNTELALAFVSSFSSLMRKVLENSRKPYISLKEEIAFLTQYLELERQRFGNKFDFAFHIDDEIDESETFLPPMLLQPHVENTVVHGLGNKKEHGSLNIHISREEGKIKVEIQDDGIGRKKAMELKALRSGSQHKSRAMGITEARLALLNELEEDAFTLSIDDLFDNEGHPSGTRVTVQFPDSLMEE